MDWSNPSRTKFFLTLGWGGLMLLATGIILSCLGIESYGVWIALPGAGMVGIAAKKLYEKA